MKKLLVYQELRTTNNSSGNPRGLIHVSIMDIDVLKDQDESNHNMSESYMIERSYRSAYQVVTEHFNTDDFHCKRLPDIRVTVKQYRDYKKGWLYVAEHEEIER